MGLLGKEEVARPREARKRGLAGRRNAMGTRWDTGSQWDTGGVPGSLKLVCYQDQQNSIPGLFVM